MALVTIPIVKGKSTRDFELDDLPQEVYLEAIKIGLKDLANRGTSKITKSAYPDAEDLQAAANAKADEQVELIMSGGIRFMGGARKSKVSGAVMTEARRLAKNAVKDGLKEQGYKLSTIEASEITRLANELLAGEDGQSFVEDATANLEERAKKAVKIDLKGKVKVSDKLVKAAEEKKAKAKAKAGLSKTQAGIVQARSKGAGARANLQ